MHFRPFRSLFASAFALALSLGLASPAGAAGARDKEVQKIYDSAINDDYLGAEFDKAEKKLKDAISKCGSSGCSTELLGKLHIALGTVYAVGLNKNDEGKAELVLALKTDPKAALDPNLTTPELSKLFEEAKKSAGSSKPPAPTPDHGGGDTGYTPPPESQVNTPLPIYVEPADDVPLSKVTLRYKPFGATQYKSVELKKMGKGYGGEIPCEDVTTTGDIKYFFALTGADGDAAGTLGSSKDPFKTTIKNEIEGAAPKLPGKKPPEQCKEKGDCPPGLPGCEGKVKHGDKGWGSSCEASSECKEGLVCLNGTCEEGGAAGGGDKPDDGVKKRMNMVSVGVEIDLLVLNGANNVCDGTNAAYVCFYPGGSTQFSGTPLALPNTDGIQGGGGLAGARILVGYERQLVKKLGFTLGLRLGYAFGGPGSPSNTDMLNMAGQSPAKAFLPFHGEGRVSYYLWNSMMEDKKFRPYAFLAGGVAQVNASVPVALCDKQVMTGEKLNCGNSMLGGGTIRNVNAYQITGLNFAGFGLGTTFGITPLFGLSAELKFMFMVPTFGVVVAPTISPVFNF